MKKKLAPLKKGHQKNSVTKDGNHHIIRGVTKFNAADHWKGMPEFKQDNLKPRKIIVSLVDEAAALKFFKLIGQKYSRDTKSVWFPKVDNDSYMDKRYTDKK